ncbi:MAG: ATP-binding cassette domain-containing protein [Micromonosporaceae bacterium]|nr:ATP-binding cassette domain-containing protein [Micromonosporaceae bacterium]
MVTSLRLRDLVALTPVDGARWRVSATVSPGELVAVDAGPAVGTALARTVVGLVAPVSGSVWLDDQDITAVPPVDRHVGYVPPGGGLLPHLTVGENIEYGLRRRETVRELVRDWVQTVVAQLELGPTLHLRPHLLSEGQRLRAALARTVACLPEVLVLDLPHGAPIRPRELLARIRSPLVSDMSTVVFTDDPQLFPYVDRVVAAHPIEPREVA